MEKIAMSITNTLAIAMPDLAAEWHPTKNGDLRPTDVTCGSGKNVWWLIHYKDDTGKHFEFEWQDTVIHRSKYNRGCPYISGRAVWKGFNDLATVNPRLAKEWHPKKNTISPYEITANSRRAVWWCLPYDDPDTGKHFDFEWEAVVKDRNRGTGCPYLSGQSVWPGFNDLATIASELALQWHPVKNGDLKPTDVTKGYDKKVWWLFPYDDFENNKHFDFEWEDTISHRLLENRGCPFLSGHAVWPGFNDLNATHYELATQWHPAKNGNLKPTDVTKGYDKKVWWYLPYDDPTTGKHFDFEWETSVNSRISNDSGCPYLTGQSVWTGFNDLATINPALASEWHPTKNIGRKDEKGRDVSTPDKIAASSGIKVWWILEYDDPRTNKHFVFEWEAPVSRRTAGANCPYLSNQKIIIGFNDLTTVHPELAKEWHPFKNKGLKNKHGEDISTPDKVTANSGHKVWWLLHYYEETTDQYFDFEWQSTVVARVGGDGCPYLSGHAVWPGFNDLVTTHPDVAKEWDYKKNGMLIPNNFVSGSDKKVWWKCTKGHKWKTTISHRTHGRGCPLCKESKGEQAIRKTLKSQNIIFQEQYIFPDRFFAAKTAPLRDDFAILNQERQVVATIEYHGEQHYRPVDFAGRGNKWAKEQFVKTQNRDQTKSNYLKSNNIPQLIIPYWEIDNVHTIINDLVDELLTKYAIKEM